MMQGQDRRMKKKTDISKYETVYKGMVNVKAENWYHDTIDCSIIIVIFVQDTQYIDNSILKCEYYCWLC